MKPNLIGDVKTPKERLTKKNVSHGTSTKCLLWMIMIPIWIMTIMNIALLVFFIVSV